MKILSKYDFTNKELPFEIPKKVWEVCFINKGCILNEVRQMEVDCFILFDNDTIYPACTNMGGFEYVANVFGRSTTKIKGERKWRTVIEKINARDYLNI